MPTRNIILLIAAFALIAASVLGFFYFYQPKAKVGPEEKPNFIATMWPFGKSGDSAPTDSEGPADVSGYEPGTGAETPSVNLRKVSSIPVAGYGVFMKERYGETAVELAPYVRYADKAVGNVYQTFADNIDERKYSITTVPRLHEARFGNGGEVAVMRYLSNDTGTIATFVGTMPKEVLGGDAMGENEMSGSFMPENISDLSLSPDAIKMFYLLPVGEGVVGISSDVSGENKSQVFDSPYTEWLSQWPNARMIALTTKPSSRVPGYMYSIDPLTKEFSKILGGVNGLTTLTSPSGKLILYADGSLSMRIFNRDTRKAVQAGVRTLPEKCAWGRASDSIYCGVPKFTNGAAYPDSWYQGETSFSDEIWKIDALTGNGRMLTDPISEEGGEDVDAMNLSLDDGEKYLFFMNKKDNYLWELAL